MTETPPPMAVNVEQADVDAAAPFIRVDWQGAPYIHQSKSADSLREAFARHRLAQQSAATGGEGPYLSQADAWNDALEKSAEIVERYNASFEDPECGGAPDDIRALKRPTTPSNPPAPSDVDQARTTVLEWLNGRPLSIATPTPLDAIRLITDFTGERR